MYEFNIILTTGEEEILFGYSLKDACRRHGIDLFDVQKVWRIEYID